MAVNAECAAVVRDAVLATRGLLLTMRIGVVPGTALRRRFSPRTHLEAELRLGLRPAEQIALHLVDAGRAQQTELLLGLDAFGSDQDVERIAEAFHRADDR